MILSVTSTLPAEAAQAKAEIQAIARRTVSLRETVAYLRDALKDERSSSLLEVATLYEAVGAELPSAVIKRRMEQVEAFRQSVLANRRSHLIGEIAEAESKIAEGERRSRELDRKRSEILTALRSGGALEDLIDLQKRLDEAMTDMTTGEGDAWRAGWMAALDAAQSRLGDIARDLRLLRREDCVAAHYDLAADTVARLPMPDALREPTGLDYRGG